MINRPYFSNVHPVAALLIYLGIIFLGGALLAPWICQLALWSRSHFLVPDSWATQPFHRYLSRAFLILALAGLWPFLRSVGMRSWQDLGLGRSAGRWRTLGGGFIIGFGSLAFVAASAVIFRARILDLHGSASTISGSLLKALLSAIVVAILEETIFRGALFGSLKKVYPWFVALFLSSIVFAAVHFLRGPSPDKPINWISGLVVLPQVVTGFGSLTTLLPAFFNLTLAGLVLGLAYQRTRSLYSSIGIHGGWIFWQKTYGFLTRDANGVHSWIWGTAKMTDGWLASIVLLLTLRFCWELEDRRNGTRK
jgi:membrane protease YdiL (CAAX protease family)